MRQAWMRLAVGYWRDPKFDGLTPQHEAMYVRLLAYTVEHDTDGLIPANAVALCGRRIYNREKVIRDLLERGLILESEPSSLVYTFPHSWNKYQQSSAISKHESPGQRPAFGRTGDEESRGYSKSKPRDQQPQRLNIDGVLMEWRDGQWNQADSA